MKRGSMDNLQIYTCGKMPSTTKDPFIKWKEIKVIKLVLKVRTIIPWNVLPGVVCYIMVQITC